MLAGAEIWPWMGEDDLLLTSLGFAWRRHHFDLLGCCCFPGRESWRFYLSEFYPVPPVGAQEKSTVGQKGRVSSLREPGKLHGLGLVFMEDLQYRTLLLLPNKVTLSLHLLMIFKV